MLSTEQQASAPPRLEIAADHPEAVLAAVAGGAERLELCSSLADGGLTPTTGFVEWALAETAIPIHCLVRPRAGSFVYSPAELAVMVRDIQRLKQVGVHGIVVGALTPEHIVDAEALRQLVETARPMRVCFHRAFDVTADREAALEVIIESGAEILLTSGGAVSLPQGADAVRALAKRAGNRIEIVGGAGVRIENAGELWRTLPIATLHASLRTPWPGSSLNSSSAQMGVRDAEPLYTVRSEDVRAVLDQLSPR